MAVRFDAHADRLLYSGTPASMSAYTFACWLRITTDRNNYSNVFAVETNGLGTEWNELMTDSDGTTLTVQDHAGGGSTAINLGALTVGTWYFAAFSVGTSGAGVGYLASASASGLTRTTGTVAVMTTHHHCTIGSTDFSEFFNGRITGARLWDAVLSDADIEQERWRTKPVRRANLRAWWPLQDSAGKLVDRSGNGRALTSPGAGAWQTEDGPPTFGRRRKTVTVSTPTSGATGTLAQTLGNATSSATGGETFTGTTAQTLANATLAGTGTGAATGTLAQTLANATSSASGTETFAGTTAVTLANATSSAAGAETISGSTSSTLAGATSAGTGAETFTGTSAVTLASATLAGFGVMGTGGSASATLADATAVGAGTETFTGSVGVTLGNATSAAAGAETFTGSSASTLADASCSASGAAGTSDATGSLAVTLGNATAVISGAVAGVEPTDAWAHYRFNEIGNQVAIADASGNARTLFPSYDVSGFPKRVAGKLGKARDFSRANATTHPVATTVILSPFVLDRTAAPSQAEVTAFADNEWSTAFWFRRRTDETPGGAGVVWSLGSSGRVSTGGVFQIMRTTVRFSTLSGGIFQALTDRLVGATVFGLGGSFTTYNPPVGRWIHVGIVCRHVSGSLVVDLYIDGTLVETKTSIITGLPNFTTYPPAAPTFTVGARCQALTAAQDPTEPIVFTGPLSGAVDDLRLYARELAADEVAAIAAAYAPYTGRVYFELLNPGASSAVLSSPGEATTELIAPSYSRAELLTEGTRITLEDS